VRASAIALFYAAGTLLGGIAGPFLFGRIVGSGSRSLLFLGYGLGAVAMIAADIVQAIWGVAAEGRSLDHSSVTICPKMARAWRRQVGEKIYRVMITS
jgi:hypothetical protein